MQNKVLVLGSLVLVLLLFIGFSFFYKSEQKVEQVATTPNINELLLATFLALGLNAAPLDVESTITDLKIKDQHEVEKVIDTNVKTILFASDKSTSDMLRDYLLPLSEKENILEKNSAVYVADISGMPSLISKFIALPKMKKYPFSVLLLDDTNKDNFVKEDGKIIVYSLENGKVVKIDKISTKEELAKFIK